MTKIEFPSNLEILKDNINKKLIIYTKEIKSYKIMMLKIIQNQDLNKLCISLSIFYISIFNFIFLSIINFQSFCLISLSTSFFKFSSLNFYIIFSTLFSSFYSLNLSNSSYLSNKTLSFMPSMALNINQY